MAKGKKKPAPKPPPPPPNQNKTAGGKPPNIKTAGNPGGSRSGKGKSNG